MDVDVCFRRRFLYQSSQLDFGRFVDFAKAI